MRTRLRRAEDIRSFSPAYGIIRTLRKASRQYLDRSSIQKTRDDARELLKQLGKVEALLSASSVSPELKLRLGLDKTLTVEESVKSPAGRLLSAIAEVKTRSDQAVQNQPSEDQVKIWCARIAHNLIIRFSDEVPTSGSAASTYRVLATLLYEILSGEEERDLKRACDDHLRAMRSLTHD